MVARLLAPQLGATLSVQLHLQRIAVVPAPRRVAVLLTNAVLTAVPPALQLIGKGDAMKIDESSLTGESLPVTRRPGDSVRPTPFDPA